MANRINATWAHVRKELTRPRQIIPALEQQPDINRGEQRLAAEVAIALLKGWPVDKSLELRARTTLFHLARSG